MFSNKILLLFVFVAFLKEIVAFSKGKKNKECQDGYFFDGRKCAECGLTYIKPNTKIVNGLEAIPGSWPSAVFVTQTIRIKELNRTLQSPCGGTLINRRTVLYASHCVAKIVILDNVTYHIGPDEEFPTTESRFKVYIGAHNYTSNNDPNMITRTVSKVIMHENYSNKSFINDIALLILSEPVPLNARINVACLPKDKSVTYPEINRTAYVAGWGLTSERGNLSDVLLNINFTIHGPKVCQELFSSLETNFDSQICAGQYDGLRDPCSGDSGGALMVTENIKGKKKNVAAGIVSYGKGCSRPQTLGVYTRTSYYLDWIKQNSVI